MIGKVPRPGTGFKGLVAYLLDGDKRSPKKNDNRVAWTRTRNLLVEDPRKVPPLMRATAARSKRVKKPVYHYVISWHRDEAPTDEQMELVADTTCTDLGLEDYQLLYIAHHDTEHRHVHIVANRIHPETGIAWKTSHDYRRIEQSLRRQSESMGFPLVPGRHTNTEYANDKPLRAAKDPAFQKAKREKLPVARPGKLANHRKAAFLLAYETATSWDNLAQNLAAFGFRLHRKGQGLLVQDGESFLKLSQIERNTRFAVLREKFGEPEPSTWTEPETLDNSVARRHAIAGMLERKALTPKDQTTKLRQANDRVAERASRPAEPDPDLEQRRRLYLDLDDASAETDFAFALHALGLVDQAGLQRSLDRLDEAKQKLNESRDLMTQLAMEAAKKLAPRHPERSNPPPEPTPPQPKKDMKRGRRRKNSYRR